MEIIFVFLNIIRNLKDRNHPVKYLTFFPHKPAILYHNLNGTFSVMH